MPIYTNQPNKHNSQKDLKEGQKFSYHYPKYFLLSKDNYLKLIWQKIILLLESDSLTTYSVRLLHLPIPNILAHYKKKKKVLKEAAENWDFKLKMVVTVVLDLHFPKSFL